MGYDPPCAWECRGLPGVRIKCTLCSEDDSKKQHKLLRMYWVSERQIRQLSIGRWWCPFEILVSIQPWWRKTGYDIFILLKGSHYWNFCSYICAQTNLRFSIRELFIVFYPTVLITLPTFIYNLLVTQLYQSYFQPQKQLGSLWHTEYKSAIAIILMFTRSLLSVNRLVK